MKQTIVLIATVTLGLFIFALIHDFQTPVKGAVDSAVSVINDELPGATPAP